MAICEDDVRDADALSRMIEDAVPRRDNVFLTSVCVVMEK
jgi:hypothetical protein